MNFRINTEVTKANPLLKSPSLGHLNKAPGTGSKRSLLCKETFRTTQEGSYKVVEGQGVQEVPGAEQKLLDSQLEKKKQILRNILKNGKNVDKVRVMDFK